MIDVIDKGIGMTAQEQEFLFSRYFQSHKKTTTRNGLGIGLSIIKHIARHHNWSINIKSETNKGTCVQLRLPITS